MPAPVLVPLTQNQIRHLLNNVTPGTHEAKLGDIIIALQTGLTAAQAAIVALQAA